MQVLSNDKRGILVSTDRLTIMLLILINYLFSPSDLITESLVVLFK